MPTAAQKAKATAAAPKEATLGSFAFAKETAATHKFEQTVEDGRNIPQYVSKAVLETLGNPESIEVIIRAA